MKIALLIVATAGWLTACSPSQPPEPPKIAEPQRQALDKAKAVSGTIEQQAERNKQAIDAASE